MGVNKEDIEQSNKDFGESFNQETPAPVEQTEDEAFGLNIPEQTADETGAPTDNEPGANAVATEDTPPAEETPVQEGATPPEAGETPEAGAAPAEDEPSQAEKSWEGRLKAREAELKKRAEELDAREKALGERTADELFAEELGDQPEGEESPAEEAAETPEEEAAEGGEIDADEAIRQLSEDFGPDFVKMIMAIAGKKAEEIAASRTDEVSRTLKDVIDDIQNSRQRRHFLEIYRTHPDFVEVNESEGFKKWIGTLAPERKEEAERILNAGDAYEINQLLSEYKATEKSGDKAGAGKTEQEPDDVALDDAEGVRSTGIRLPEEPGAGADDFAKAWELA